MKLSKWCTELKKNYLFQIINEKTKKFKYEHPDLKLINMGIGDVSLPLSHSIVNACKLASQEMGNIETFRGYGPSGGYEFLKKSIQSDYSSRNISIDLDEIFISDGAKSDMSNILDIFSSDNTCIIPDPVYPVYLDTSIMKNTVIKFANCTEENDFLPLPDMSVKADIIYICSPNNPTGASYSKSQLKQWVDYANYCDAIILYDAAYESFIQDDSCRSIFEVEGADLCSIEFKSFSKSAGFTGMRCGYSIVSKKLKRQNISINSVWSRRHSTKFNGVPYIIQRAAEASLSPEGKKECKKLLEYYKKNTRLVSDLLNKHSIKFFGGTNSPYVWMKCPGNMKSWEFFDYMLENFQIIGTPGSGFGENGENYFRLSCFGLHENVLEACKRLESINKNT